MTTTEPTSAPRLRDPALRRARIEETARRLFSELGYTETSTARIVSACVIDLAHVIATAPPPDASHLDCEREISRMLLAYLRFGSQVELPEPVAEVPIQ